MRTKPINDHLEVMNDELLNMPAEEIAEVYPKDSKGRFTPETAAIYGARGGHVSTRAGVPHGSTRREVMGRMYMAMGLTDLPKELPQEIQESTGLTINPLQLAEAVLISGTCDPKTLLQGALKLGELVMGLQQNKGTVRTAEDFLQVILEAEEEVKMQWDAAKGKPVEQVEHSMNDVLRTVEEPK